MMQPQSAAGGGGMNIKNTGVDKTQVIQNNPAPDQQPNVIDTMVGGYKGGKGLRGAYDFATKPGDISSKIFGSEGLTGPGGTPVNPIRGLFSGIQDKYNDATEMMRQFNRGPGVATEPFGMAPVSADSSSAALTGGRGTFAGLGQESPLFEQTLRGGGGQGPAAGILSNASTNGNALSLSDGATNALSLSDGASGAHNLLGAADSAFAGANALQSLGGLGDLGGGITGMANTGALLGGADSAFAGANALQGADAATKVAEVGAEASGNAVPGMSTAVQGLQAANKLNKGNYAGATIDAGQMAIGTIPGVSLLNMPIDWIQGALGL